MLILSMVHAGHARSKNGFDLNNAIIPYQQIEYGGTPKDGIAALINPPTIFSQAADYLKPNDRVLGVSINGTARAYPITILNWHEVVNDRIGDQHFVVTYCPLCGTGMVFGTNIADTALRFGVSGLLYNSDVLLYDLNTQSLWSQILRQAISGPLAKTQLPQLAARHTTWSAWQKMHPETTVLSLATGYKRPYHRSPYQGYEKSRQIYFDVTEAAPRDYHPKALVMGIERQGRRKVYPFKELQKHGKPRFKDKFCGEQLTIVWDEDTQSAWVLDEEAREIPVTTGYWFAWYAFYPKAEVFRATETLLRPHTSGCIN